MTSGIIDAPEVQNSHLWHGIQLNVNPKKLAETSIYIYQNNTPPNINTAQLVEPSKARSIEPHGTLQLMKSEPDVRFEGRRSSVSGNGI